MGNSVLFDAAIVGGIVGGATGRVIGMQFGVESAAEDEVFSKDMGMVAGFWCGAAGGLIVATEGMCDDAPDES